MSTAMRTKSAKASGWVRCAPWRGTGELDDLGAGNVPAEVFHRLAVMGERALASAEHGRHRDRREVKGGVFAPQLAQLGHKRGTVGPAFVAPLLGEVIPRRRRRRHAGRILRRTRPGPDR